jgi:hypothetical protein
MKASLPTTGPQYISQSFTFADRAISTQYYYKGDVDPASYITMPPKVIFRVKLADGTTSPMYVVDAFAACLLSFEPEAKIQSIRAFW